MKYHNPRMINRWGLERGRNGGEWNCFEYTQATNVYKFFFERENPLFETFSSVH